MSDALRLLLTRRSVGAQFLKDPAPDADQLRTLLTAATRVPDHGKLAPWRFIVFSGEARVEFGAFLAACVKSDEPDADADRLEIERTRLSRAPLVICVVSRAAPHVKIPEWEQALSCGAVCMNLLHAAHAMGFAASWLTEWYAYDARSLAKLGLADGEQVAGFIHIGTPDVTPQERPRPELADLVTDWHQPF